MLGCRTAIGVGCCALALGWVAGCGGAVTHSGPLDDDPVSGSGGSSKPSGRAGYSAGGSSSAGRSGAGGSAGKPVKDPPPVTTACPMEDLPPPIFECDPAMPDACGPGAGCYPFVDHPEGKGCDAQVYGTACMLAGLGTQGMLCGDDNGDWCAPGFVCVVGQRAGTRCAQLCDLTVANPCPGGLICGDLDVAGFGVCG